ncbi:MAG: dual specificity protein phosphatase family protein [Lentisphaeraceae bacterium]|nr:dual specificity protein phosphatase family protein [Lentisphaeraceae bacterium]
MSHFEKIWWLEENIIGGMRQPEIKDIPELYEQGLRAVASFLEDPENLEEYKANNIESCWVPVEDDLAPTREQIEEFSAFADKMKDEEKPLAVHCKGGNGRAGTMLAGHFILKGRDSHEVLSWMRSINPKAVRTKIQEDFLHSL